MNDIIQRNEKIDSDLNDIICFSVDSNLLYFPSNSPKPKEDYGRSTIKTKTSHKSRKSSNNRGENNLQKFSKKSTISLRELEYLVEENWKNPRIPNKTKLFKGRARHKEIMEKINLKVFQEAKMAQSLIKREEVMKRAVGNLAEFQSMKHFTISSEMAKKAAKIMAGNDYFQQMAKTTEMVKRAAKIMAGNDYFQQIAKTNEMVKRAAKIMAGNDYFQQIAKTNEMAIKATKLMVGNDYFQQMAKTNEMIKKSMVNLSGFQF